MKRASTSIKPVTFATASVTTPAGKTDSVAWTDWLGMLASVGCTIHCAAMPFVIAYLPALGLSFFADAAFHKWMAVGCFAIAMAAFVPGLRRHRRWSPAILGSVGLAMISIAAFGFAGECCPTCEGDSTSAASTAKAAGLDTHCPSRASKASSQDGGPDVLSSSHPATSQSPSPWVGRIVSWLTPLGGIVLVCSHLLNRRYGRLCGCCGSEVVEKIN